MRFLDVFSGIGAPPKAEVALAPEGPGTIAGGKRARERRPRSLWLGVQRPEGAQEKGRSQTDFPRPSGARRPGTAKPGAALADSLAPGYFPLPLRGNAILAAVLVH